MTKERLLQIAFQAIQMLRKTERKPGKDWKDIDDYIFSELDIEKGELLEIFEPYSSMVYVGSCFPDGESPKDYDAKYFKEI